MADELCLRMGAVWRGIMIEVVIVDDEMLSRIGIQTLLDGVKDVHVSQTFDNAEEALDYLKENPADILLTDLEMVGMQGMDLIREVKKQYVDMGTLILSCHSDFDYAREALKIGADGYLLKHELNIESLSGEIRKIHEKKSKNRFRSNSVKRQHARKEGQSLLYRIGVIQFCQEEQKQNLEYSRDQKEQGAGIDRKMAVHFLEELLLDYGAGTLFAPAAGDMFVVFQADRSLSDCERQENFAAVAACLKEDIERIMSQRIILGVSREFERTEEIPERYKEASKALDGVSPLSDKYLFFYQEEPFDELKAAMDFIKNHLEEGLSGFSLAEIAKDSNMSIPSFCKKFKAKTGKTMVQYVNECKVEMVKEKLADRNLSLTEIAEQTGFSNENYMVRVFKKITGSTVTDYRKMN